MVNGNCEWRSVEYLLISFESSVNGNIKEVESVIRMRNYNKYFLLIVDLFHAFHATLSHLRTNATVSIFQG